MVFVSAMGDRWVGSSTWAFWFGYISEQILRNLHVSKSVFIVHVRSAFLSIVLLLSTHAREHVPWDKASKEFLVPWPLFDLFILRTKHSTGSPGFCPLFIVRPFHPMHLVSERISGWHIYSPLSNSRHRVCSNMPPKAPHPIDRSRLQGYVTSKRVCHAISAAYGTRLNARNMECDYYPAYNHTLSELSDFEFHADGALTVREQYDLWLSKETLNIYKLPPDAFDHANRAQQPMPAPLQPAEPAAALPPPPAAAVAAPAAPLHAAADEQPAQPPAPAAAARTTYWERVPSELCIPCWWIFIFINR